ncbi:Receptor-like serine/threonine-protein kinase [Heracleum sosnowskyi]|uniref:Receptor-like serine/threonine-protein kinase n=1 Tax=Heracleum sosnowskyi TaxID=360622 RepID=A0AAD8HSK4_9APIA|nr:Receptor-like serine/threonine-protein kinase [Heracleum sosnowskyi]
MANFLFSLLVLLSAKYIVTAQQKVSNSIRQSSTLTPTGNSSWLSPSGLFAFGFYPQGNNSYRVGIFLAGLPLNKTVVWTANRDDPPISNNVTLRLTPDGRLILQQQSQVAIKDVLTPNHSISSASMLDTGNFVLYDSNQKMIWQSFDHPTDAILPGQILSQDQVLLSSMSESDYSTGLFKLKMQSDGNLVQHPVDAFDSPENAYCYSATATEDGVNVTLNLDPDGHLYLLNNSVTILKNLTAGFSKTRRLYLMRIDFDGIFRLYSFSLDNKGNSSSIVWESSGNRCDVKGICGLNGYCTLYDREPKCECPPGFDYVSPGNWLAGCARNYTADSCKNKEQRIQYRMGSLENTLWVDVPYSVLKMKTREECKTACLEDCNCEAAFYKDGDCKKQVLPLRYGRRLLDESNTAYIKWAQPVPEKEAPTDLKTRKIKKPSLDILIICVSLVALAFTVFIISAFLAYRHRSWASKKILVNRNLQLMESFTYAQLEKVTNGFQDEIGRGSSGTVYRGTFNLNNQAVAVKRLENMVAEGEKEFQNELSGVETDMIKFERMVKVGLWCVLDEPSIRPSMKKVLLLLEGTVDIPPPPSLRSYFTAI